MSRVETIGDCTLYHGDCLEILPTLPLVDAAVSDPPYGIGYCHNGGKPGGIGGGVYKSRFAGVAIAGDDRPFDPEPFLQLGSDVILWGANHYASKLPDTSAWLVWDKRCKSGHSNDFADCEIAYLSTKSVARVFRHHWDGICKDSERGQSRDHPTQKPVALMRWCLGFVPNARTILDPFAGSGTTGVACVELGRKFIGIELDEKYFDIACRRIEQAVKKQSCKLPGFAAKKPQQGELF